MPHPLPLGGIRILDLTHFWSGPFGTSLLGFLGAEVVKIESPNRVDAFRLATQVATEGRTWETNPQWNGANVNKLGCTLNLDDSRGLELFKQLVAVSDMVVENFSARVMGSFGLEYPVLRGMNPSIIMLSLPPFGKTGSWKDNVGWAATFEQMGGAFDANGYSDDDLPYGVLTLDPIVGYALGFAAVSALIHRRETGQGQYVEMSQVDVCATTQGKRVVEYVACGRYQGRIGNSHPVMAPHGCYPCAGKDSWITISVTGDPMWERLVEAMGRPRWASGVEMKTLGGRWGRREEIHRELSKWTSSQNQWDLMRRLQEAGVAAAGVRVPSELDQDPHLRERGFFQRLDREIVGAHEYPRFGFLFRGVKLQHQRPAPLLGEHNEYMLAQVLGLSRPEMEELEREQVIGNVPLPTPA